MERPAILQGDSPIRPLQGAAVGAIATLFVGFYWGGWVTGGSAKEMVQRSSSSAVVAALSPICVDKFQQSANAATTVELRKVSSYQQGTFIEKGGWVTLPGSDNANSLDARAIYASNLKREYPSAQRRPGEVGAARVGRGELIARNMALMFPNQSRSYDATRRAVRFWGHDSAMEWSFFVTEDALKQVDPAVAGDEAGMLGAFDLTGIASALPRAGPIRAGAKAPTSSAPRTSDRDHAHAQQDVDVFSKPFTLKGVDRPLPAGDDRVTTGRRADRRLVVSGVPPVRDDDFRSRAGAAEF